jgi:hypothetical protein
MVLMNRRAFRSGSAGEHMPGAPALDFLRRLRAFEHAWWSVVSSKYDGNLLDY